MSNEFESVISQDWDDIAIDDGLINEEYGSYLARVYPREGTSSTVIESQVDSIGYSPEVNAAVPITVDVEPRDRLKGTDYLSGIVDVFVNSQPLFSGEIVRIESNDKEDEFYTIKAKSPGQKLDSDTIDTTTDNNILSDFIAKTIDKYNEFDDEHFNLTDTSQENLSNIQKRGKNTRVATSDGATAEYTFVGDDASLIEKIYAKISSPSNSSVDITVETVSGSYQETFFDLNESRFGQWVSIEPSNLPSESYSVTFTLDNDSVLFDWISLTEQVVQREVRPETAEKRLENEVVQTASQDSEFSNIISDDIEDNNNLKVDSNSLNFLQTAFYGVDSDEMIRETVADTSGMFFEEASNYTANNRNDSGEGYQPEINGESVYYPFFTEYKMPAGEWKVMLRFGDPDEALKVRQASITVDGQEVESFVDGFETIASINWTEAPGDFDLDSGSHEVRFEITNDGEDDPSTYDPIPIDIIGVYDDRFSYNFDNQVDSNFNLDGPEKFPTNSSSASTVQTNEIIFSDVVTEGTSSLSANDAAGIDEIGISFDSGISYFTNSNSTSIFAENADTTASVRSRFRLKGFSPNGEQNKTPKFGYAGQSISSYDLSIDTVDVEILFNKQFSENRLSVITGIADNSTVDFRWEGNRCVIITDKELSDVNLRKESVDSITDIEDVYSSVEVVGDGVTSGIVEADNAPSYIDNHKRIEDSEISIKQDALRRARSFLENNSTIDFEGTIETLPTRAPVGDKVNGSTFNHGQDSVISRVRYSKRNSTIECDRQKDLRKEILKLDRE
jgi:hypothetical protein